MWSVKMVVGCPVVGAELHSKACHRGSVGQTTGGHKCALHFWKVAITASASLRASIIGDGGCQREGGRA